jgi:hypothetical protein
MAHKIQKKSPTLLLPPPSLWHNGVRVDAQILWLRLAQLTTPLNAMFAGVLVYLLLSASFTVSFFVPHTVNFSFANNNCFTSPTLLPNMIAKNQGQAFAATPHQTISVAGYPLYSHTTCVTPTQAPQDKMVDNISFSPLGIGLLKKKITVSAKELPTIDFKTLLSQPISTQDPLVFPLSTTDKFFDYQLLVNDQRLACSKHEDSVVCDVTKLGLRQSASYTFGMQRLFKGQAQTLFSQNASTVGAVLVAGSSITAGDTIFNVPTDMTLTVNKQIKSFNGVQLNLISDGNRQSVPISSSAVGQTITVHFNEPLARSSSFELTVKTIIATDGGHLPEPLVLAFATSGGPKVKSASIGSYKVSTGSNIVLNFDSTPSATQALANFIKIEINGSTVAASLSRSGTTITLNPNADLPKCTRFSVRVLNGLQNEFGVAGGSAWTYNSRTICQSTFSIGTSVQGRSISAYRFGSGGGVIVFVGGTHGNEKSSVYTLNSFMDYLEQNYDQIPAHRTIVVIPNLNPDGYAKDQRTNANNVDLNRNFPADDWKQGVTMPGGSYNPNGGGSAPLSEPESNALASYVQSVNPRLVLTYHAAAGVVIANDAGDSDSLANAYDQKSNVNYSNGAGLFNYDTTGAFEDWLYDGPNITALLIELWTKSSNEFGKNQSAMWYMAQLP